MVSSRRRKSKNKLMENKQKKKTTQNFKDLRLEGKHLCLVCSIGKGRPTGGVAMVACCPSSLAGLVDLRFDVLDGGVFGDTGLGLLVGHLSSCRGEVLITLNKTQAVSLSRMDCIQFSTSIDFMFFIFKSLIIILREIFHPALCICSAASISDSNKGARL